jgi:hypothetical protein
MYQHKKNVVATRSDDHTPAVSSFFFVSQSRRFRERYNQNDSRGSVNACCITQAGRRSFKRVVGTSVSLKTLR